jgi:uncharacterized SAM-dependent methyltransferase
VGQKGTAVIGADLTKDIRVPRAVYNDRRGVTAAFNTNLLARINRELDGDFRLDRFAHEARWNNMNSAVEMHLVSLDAQTAMVDGQSYDFEIGESIHKKCGLMRVNPSEYSAWPP